ncbi:MAG: 2-oxoacid:acceptor oxidoreductase subunit alpha [Candidatus Aenigmarchaeota archaeon]|nr:2-oxoacid:acceptor oxidoreductase subunit alpha [Candidatus Aenigmarchaeota archaeon]
MEKNILIGGEAGKGIAKTTILISKVFTKLGYYVFNYREYQSLIKGGFNFNILKISDKPIYSHENSYDVIFALNQDIINKHEKYLKEDGFIIGDKNLKGNTRLLDGASVSFGNDASFSKKMNAPFLQNKKEGNLIGIDVQALLEKTKAPAKLGNDILIGALAKVLGLPVEPVIEVVKNAFKKNFELLEATIRAGYECVEPKIEFDKPKNNEEKYFITGNEAISAGAIASGIDMYIAYPITPATPVLHILASKQIEYDYMVVQPENEIAVACSALGASYAGTNTMIGTSGAGFSLMAEALSMQGISEVPLVVYLSQRTGPATGVPTYNSQGDLKFAVNIGHGEFIRVVVAPGDAKECFYRTIEAFHLASKYRVLVMILGDKHVGESNYSFDDFEESKIKPTRGITEPCEDYKSYLITEDGVSPRSVPGQGAVVKTSSYEHDEYGHTTEKGDEVIKMNDKRFKKLEKLKEEIDTLVPVYLHGEGRKLIIGWGSTKGAIVDALKDLPDFRFLQVSYISPFPMEEVKREIENSDEVVLVENNATGLLGDIIAEQTGNIINKKVLKYDGRPFTSNEIVEKVNGAVK